MMRPASVARMRPASCARLYIHWPSRSMLPIMMLERLIGASRMAPRSTARATTAAGTKGGGWVVEGKRCLVAADLDECVCAGGFQRSGADGRRVGAAASL